MLAAGGGAETSAGAVDPAAAGDAVAVVVVVDCRRRRVGRPTEAVETPRARAAAARVPERSAVRWLLGGSRRLQAVEAVRADVHRHCGNIIAECTSKR